ncbi:MAG: transglutaminase-like domain-containing protein, partial [Lentisphaeraceae bacterium]|nr:transglutaminase-like domain-containing protein [Lentisphaeraceae bacterium]
KNNAVNKHSETKLITLDSQKQSWLKYSWQNPLHPELLKLRKDEQLDKVISPAKSEIEKFFLLLNWTRAQWETGTPNPYPAWNANTILSMIRSGKTSGFCGQYSHVLVQSLQSLGYYSRYIGLQNHFALEAYWNEGRKWIILDPLYNCVFVKNQNYLNTHEVYELINQDKTSEVTLLNTKTNIAISGDQRDTILSHYTNYNIILKADHLTSRKSGLYFVENSWQHSVVFIDEQLPKKKFLGKTPILTNHLNDLYFPTNNVSIELISQNQDQVTLELSSHYLLKEFQLSVNGTAFKKVPKRITLKNPNTIKEVKVRGLTKMGILGPATTYKLEQ